MIEVIKALEKCLSENIPCVEVSIINISGSVPGKVGFKMLAGFDGRISGTVGGGSVELYALEKSKMLLRSNEKYLTEVVIMNDTLDKPKVKKQYENSKSVQIPSLCGGKLTLFFEVFQNNKSIHLFGAGHVSQYLIKYAGLLNYFVSVYDSRENILNEIPDSPGCKKFTYDLRNLQKEIKNIVIKNDEPVIIITHNHLNDLDVLEFLYQNFKNLNYIGMIGSKRKVTEAIKYIKKKFGSRIKLSNLYAPIGIDIGGETAAEIALSIMAEIQAMNSGKNIQHLKLNG